MILDLLSICSNCNAVQEREVHFDMDSVVSKMGVFPVTGKEPFTLRLTNVENRRLLIQGALDVTVLIPCDRCLADVPVKLHLIIEKELPVPFIQPLTGEEKNRDGSGRKDQEKDRGAGQKNDQKQNQIPDQIPDLQEQLEYMNGCQLDADRLIYGELLYSWPTKVLCREDCRGICSNCGANLNEAECGCDRTAPDPRMAAFQDVFNKFKEV